MPRIQATGGAAPISGTVNIQSKGVPETSGQLVGTSETTLTIPLGTKAFRIQAANSSSAVVITISTISGGTASQTTSRDIMVGCEWREENLKGDQALTLYIKASKAATPVQLLLWS